MKHVVLILVALLALPAIGQAQTETIEYYATDAIGSIRVVFGANGAVLGRQDYGPFGQELFPAPALPAERFGGQEKDAETDQGYFHARQYQSRTGRFTRVDPIYAGLFEPQRWNRYSYALNNPLAYVDPQGNIGHALAVRRVSRCLPGRRRRYHTSWTWARGRRYRRREGWRRRGQPKTTAAGCRRSGFTDPANNTNRWRRGEAGGLPRVAASTDGRQSS